MPIISTLDGLLASSDEILEIGLARAALWDSS